MAAPNLASATAVVVGKTAVLALTNTAADIIAAVSTGHCARVEAIWATNLHTAASWVTITHKRGGVSVETCYQLPIPINGTFNLLDGKILYLEESDSLQGQADASSHVKVVVSYEDIS